jgi:3-phenylpropionate/trans-cinnamate dioxygenase ferredoxin reductase subunit
MTRIVIVGASIGGGRAADALREQGFDGEIVLVGAEPDRPYERPPLSKGYLAGEVQDDEFFLTAPGDYAERRIDLRLSTRATSLDPTTKTVTLDSGEQLGYDALLITTGATTRRLNIPGSQLSGVHYLRTVEDARAIRDDMQRAQRVAVIGMSFIGAEVAATARTLGKEVVAIEAFELPMMGALGREVAGRMAKIHTKHGVEIHTGEFASEIRGNDRVEQVVTRSGLETGCDMVVIGVGVIPEISWLDGSGIKIEGGVVVDQHCRTSLPDVYAAGDVTAWWSPRYNQHLMVQHFDNAGNQAVVAAKNMPGQDEVYDPVPYFWSDQYDLSLQFAGITQGHDQVVFRGTVAEGSWSAFYLAGRRLMAVLAVNRFKDFSAGRRLLRANAAVAPDQLADESVTLKSLL